MEEAKLEPDLKKVVMPESSGLDWLTPGFGLICGIFLISVVGNLLGTWIISKMRYSAGEEWLICASFGLLIAQACLIAIWLTLGSQSLLVRTCLSLGALFGIVCLFLLGLRLCDSSPMPAEIPIVSFGIGFVLVGTISIPLGLIRWKRRQVISRKEVEQNAEASQFGIRHLFIATAIVAILVPLAQSAFSNQGFEGGAPWLEILSFIAVYMLLSLLVCLCSVALVFGEKQRPLNGALLACAVLFGSPIGVWVLASSFGVFQGHTGEMIFNSIVYCASLSLGLVVVLTTFLAAGYRMQRV